MFKGRSTVDTIAIVFALSVAWAIVAAGATIGLLALTDRTDDAVDVVGYFESVITTTVGAMLGLIAGRAGGRTKNDVPPTETTTREDESA